MTDLLDEASWLPVMVEPDAIDDREDLDFWVLTDRVVGDLRYLLALAREAERLRELLGRLVSVGWMVDSLPEDLAHDLSHFDDAALAEPKP